MCFCLESEGARVLAGYLEPASLPSSSELAGRRSKVALAGQQMGMWKRKPAFPKVDQVPWILSVWPSRVVLQLETGLAKQKPICGPHPPPQTHSSRTYCPHWGCDGRPADSSVCLDVQVMFLMGINMWLVVFMLCADSQRTIYSPLSPTPVSVTSQHRFCQAHCWPVEPFVTSHNLFHKWFWNHWDHYAKLNAYTSYHIKKLIQNGS